jgi:hypothetical protein
MDDIAELKNVVNGLRDPESCCFQVEPQVEDLENVIAG